jgi:tRNA(Arg) A34 adenosine deaminase TadA
MKPKYFRLAQRLSRKSPSRFKLGCVIVSARVISTGVNNMEKTDPKHKTFGNFKHAELDALVGLSYEETKGGAAYIYRETANGELANARPCPICYGALRLAGIRYLCYSNQNGFQKESIK